MPMTELAISQNQAIGNRRRDICSGVTVNFGLVRSIHDNIASCMILLVVDRVWCIFAGVGCCRRRPGICSLVGVVGAMQQNPYLRDNLPGMGSRDNQPGGVSPPLYLAQSPLEVLSPPLESMWGCGQRGEYAVCCVVRVLSPLVVLPPRFV